MTDRLQQLLAFLETDPGDSFIRYALAQEYNTRGQKYQALAAYEQLLRDDPDYVGTYYHLGKLYEELDQHDEALKTYESGINTAKKASDFHALGELNNAKVNLEMSL